MKHAHRSFNLQLDLPELEKKIEGLAMCCS